ncbi:MAG: hypothetical protein NTY35_16370 [Planctomycetota bacterium]|nr:hypothetical protein [Planctomycetota bacterium]
MSPEPRGLRLSALQIAFLLAAVVACRLFAVRACPTYDDAFITYRYAANLAAGDGLVYNAGAAWEPVLGTTTLLYSLVLAGLAKLGFDLVAASLAFNVVCDVVTAILLVLLVKRRPVAATALVLGFAALPELARISVGGMESPLFLLCAVGACVAVDGRRAGLAGCLAAATCLVRPEGVLLAGILFLAQARKPADLVRYTVPLLVAGAIAIAALTYVYGTPIPQSVTAKSAMQGVDPAAEKVARFWMILRQAFLPRTAYAAVLPFAAVGIVRAIRAGGAVRNLSLFALAISVSYLAARPHTWGWYYYVPLASWILWIALGVESAWRWCARRAGPALAHAVDSFAPQAASVAIAAVAGFLSSRLVSPIQAQVYEPLWAWAERTSSAEPLARILASDIGAIGHRWKGIVLDSEGLTWPEALVHRHPAAIIEATRPEYLMVVAERPRLRHLAERPSVMADYEPIARFNATGKQELVLAPEDVPMDWSQDYLIYRRKSP